MARLEELSTGTLVKGILPDSLTELITRVRVGLDTIKGRVSLVGWQQDSFASGGGGDESNFRQDITRTKDSPSGKPKPFFRSVKLNPQRVGCHARKIAEKIIQHLTLKPGPSVGVTLQIQAQVSQGAPDTTIREVTENASTRKFSTHSFENE